MNTALHTAARVKRRSRRSQARGTRADFALYPSGLTMAEVSLLCLIGAALDLTDGGDDALVLVACGVVAAGLCFGALRGRRRPSVTSAPAVFTMTTIAFSTLGVAVALVHLVTGAVDTPDAALVEGMASATTTAMTTVVPEELSRGLLFVRAGTQWLAGFGAILVAVVVIPLASGSRELRYGAGTKALNPTRTGGVPRIAALYSGFTVITVLAYLIAGMGAFDAVAHGFTTVSTGGFSTRSGSIGAFDSASIEWVAAITMAIAGLNLGFFWWVVRRNVAQIRRGMELRWYLVTMLVATLIMMSWLGDQLPAGDVFRTSFFSVASAMSTTGALTLPWDQFADGTETLLFILVGVGAMAGSAGGGFGYLRLIEVVGYARRELLRQLHPNVVAVVKVGGRPIKERTLERLGGFITMFIAATFFGAIAMAIADTEVGPAAAVSLALSALVTAGPTIGEAGSPTVAELGSVSHLALATLMLIGRLSIYPVLLAAITVVSRGRNAAADAARRDR